jgi:hypothetical protein
VRLRILKGKGPAETFEIPDGVEVRLVWNEAPTMQDGEFRPVEHRRVLTDQGGCKLALSGYKLPEFVPEKREKLTTTRAEFHLGISDREEFKLKFPHLDVETAFEEFTVGSVPSAQFYPASTKKKSTPPTEGR